MASGAAVTDNRDLLEHARLTHISSLAVSLTLVVVLSSNTQNKLVDAALESAQLLDVVASIPDPNTLYSAARPTGVTWSNCILDSGTERPAVCISAADLEVLEYNDRTPFVLKLNRRYEPDTAAFQRPMGLRHQINPSFSIQEAEILWSSMSDEVSLTFWVLADRMVVRCSGVRNEPCVGASMVSAYLPSDRATEADYRITQVVKTSDLSTHLHNSDMTLLPRPSRERGYDDWLVGYQGRSVIIAPLVKHVTPPLPSFRLFALFPTIHGGLRQDTWRPFPIEFPTLATSEPELKRIGLVSAGGVFRSLSSRFDARELRLLGMELRVRNVAFVGACILLVLALYLLLHCLELLRRTGPDTSIAWIAVYDGRLAKITTAASLLVPAVTAIYIALVGADSSLLVWLPACAVVATSLAILFLWYKRIRPRVA